MLVQVLKRLYDCIPFSKVLPLFLCLGCIHLQPLDPLTFKHFNNQTGALSLNVKSPQSSFAPTNWCLTS